MRKIENINFTKININDEDTFKAIKKWLGYDNKDIILIDDIENFYDKVSKVLGLTGMTTDEEAELSLIADELNKFNYYASKTGNEFTFNLGMRDDVRQLGVATKELKKSYKVTDIDADLPKLELLDTVEINPESGSKVARIYSENDATFKLRNKEYSLTINISKPSTNNDEGNYHFFREDVISKYLLSLTFPINLDELYPKIAQWTGIDDDFVANYDYIRFVETKEIDSNIIGLISIVKGKLADYVPSSSDPAITEREIDFYNKVSYCTENDLDPALASNLTDLQFADVVCETDEMKPKGK